MPFGQVLHLNALSLSLCLYRLHSEKSNRTKILFFERKIFKPRKPYILVSIILYVGFIFATGIKKYLSPLSSYSPLKSKFISPLVPSHGFTTASGLVGGSGRVVRCYELNCATAIPVSCYYHPTLHLCHLVIPLLLEPHRTYLGSGMGNCGNM